LAKNQPIDAMKAYAQIPARAWKLDAMKKQQKDADAKFAAAGKALLSEVDPLIEQKQYQQASDKLSALAEAAKGLPFASEAKKKLNDMLAKPEVKQALESAKLEKNAKEMYDAAKALQAKGNHEGAYDKFSDVVRLFERTNAAKLASDEIKKYESDKTFMKK